MEHLTWAEQRRLYRWIPDRGYAAEVLGYLSDVSSREITREMTEEQLVDLIDRMEPDDATDIVAVLSEDVQQRILDELRDEDTSEVLGDLLEYPGDTAGGIMSPRMFQMPVNATCGQAILALQNRHTELESIHYLYVLDGHRRLVGVTSLRSLLTNKPATLLSGIMTREIIAVDPAEDQEEVAQFVARYDLLAIPVVDADRKLLGIVTVDDVVDVIRAELDEDMMLMAGVQGSLQEQSLLSQGARRAGWLLATLFGGILAAELIGFYEETLLAVALLAGFIPVIMGMGGNVGIQSATLAVRGLATGSVQVGGAFRFIWNEARVGLLIGALYAGLLGLYGFIRYPVMIAVSLASSIFLAIAAASILGAVVPLALNRSGVDPAIATGPFVTTLVDLLGIVIYFSVAQILLGL
jgi:magnesium transporter